MVLKSNKLFSFILALQMPLASLSVSEADLSRKINSLLVIKDYSSAVQISKKALKSYPESPFFQQKLISALAKNGEDQKALQTWIHYHKDFQLAEQNHTLEEIAWSILAQSSQSSSLILRNYSLIGALLTQDSQAIDLIKEQMSSTNVMTRIISINLSVYLGDEPLKKEILRLIKEEKILDVRIAAIKAAGKMRLKDAKPELEKIVSQDFRRAEEKGVAIESLINLTELNDLSEIPKLIKSYKMGLRLLACELIANCVHKTSFDLKLITDLFKDSHAKIRAAACRLMGLKIYPYDEQILLELSNDSDPQVALTAIWVIFSHNPEYANEKIEIWLNHSNNSYRTLAASVLAHSGSLALPYMKKVLQAHKDLFVRANVAFGLIGHQQATQEASLSLYELLQQKALIMMDDSSGFDVLTTSQIPHHPYIPSYPEAVDQMTRLKILNLLAIIHSPFAKEGLIEFLEQKSWGISGMASATLLEEGDVESAELVRSCLNSENIHVRIQAALVLANWLKDNNALGVLYAAYNEVDRETKIKILEAIGHIGSLESIPFLVDRLQEPFQAERIVAAFAVIHCLNH